MKPTEILNLIQSLDNGIDSFFAIRCDRATYAPGDAIANSHQLWQDDPADWGEEAEYLPEIGMWDAGELDGACGILIWDYRPTADDVAAALKRAQIYRTHGRDHMYLITGSSCVGGNDIGEVIVRDARCVATIC